MLRGSPRLVAPIEGHPQLGGAAKTGDSMDKKQSAAQEYWQANMDLLNIGLEALRSGKSADQVASELGIFRIFSATSRGSLSHLPSKM